MEKIIIDAEGLLLGRMGTYAAKQLLLGNEVIIVNAGRVSMSGTKRDILSREKAKAARGTTINQGPFYYRNPATYVKRTVRGMLPSKKSRGEEALKRLRVYTSNTQGLKANVKIENASVEKLPNIKFVELSKILNIIGAQK